MKIRYGFISNSSSTSFVLMTSPENHEKALAKLDEYSRAVIEAMKTEKHEFFSKEVIAIGSIGDHWSPVSIVKSIEIEPKKEKYRGCLHKLMKGATHCHKCGAQAYYEKTVQTLGGAWEKYKKIVEKGDHILIEMRN